MELKWDRAAEEAVAKAPFFVRKRVKRKVEEEARQAGSSVVRLEHVKSAQQRYLSNMEDEVQGWRLERCFGPGGCPNRAFVDEKLEKDVERILAEAELRALLKERVNGPLKIHHEFRVSWSDCPNCCSRPQIADIGLIGAVRPEVADTEACSGCGACVDACQEAAIVLETGGPGIDLETCLSCGKCVTACPTGTIRAGKTGLRVQLGGRLGRRPRLAEELSGIFEPAEALALVTRCLDFYKKHNRSGERFGDLLAGTGVGPVEKNEDVLQS